VRRTGIILGLLALFASPSGARAQADLGDIGAGHALARKTCAECHHVEKNEKSPKLSPAKSFQEIALNPARTALSLRVFLRTPHYRMPNFVLTEAETDNLIAYIHSLK